jgi:hypothetical protein
MTAAAAAAAVVPKPHYHVTPQAAWAQPAYLLN